MSRYRTDAEIRRYDTMKLLVLLGLLASLVVVWLLTNDQLLNTSGTEEPLPAPTSEVSVVETPVIDTGAEDLQPTAVPAPSLNPVAGDLLAGRVLLSGSAAPGSQVIVVVDDRPVGAATAGVDGAWSVEVDIPPGDHVVQLQQVDNLGGVVAVSEPVSITVVDESTVSSGAVQVGAPSFDPLGGVYTVSGTGVPGAVVVAGVDGVPVATTTADADGNWTITLPADAASGAARIETTDADGNTIAEPLDFGSATRPPGLNAPEQVTINPETGETQLVLPAGSNTLSGQGAPGTQVEVVAGGSSLGTALVDADGNWTLAINLPDGTYDLQLNTLDESGSLLSSAASVSVVVGSGMAQGGIATPAPQPTVAPEATSEAVSAESMTIGQFLASQPERFSTLLAALQISGLAEALSGTGPFTVFAPSDEAFALLPDEVTDALVQNPEALSQVLQYHAARGRYLAADLVVVAPSTLNNRLLTITPAGDTLRVNDATVISPDIVVSNGVIHVLDRVLVPPLAPDVRPPVIDESGIPTFTGPLLTVVGTGQPGSTILLEMNGESFGAPVVIDGNGNWQVSDEIAPGDYEMIAYMLDADGILQAISRAVNLPIK